MKKYYKISEAAEILGLPQHQLRYHEKNLPELEIFKISGRRYYSKADIENFKIYFSSKEVKGTMDEGILVKINQLIEKFNLVSAKLIRQL